MNLIAKVTVVAMVDGERREFQRGGAHRDLHEHDVTSLKSMGAIEDPADAAAAQKEKKAAEKESAAEFEAARKAVQSASASTGAGAKKKGAGAAGA